METSDFLFGLESEIVERHTTLYGLIDIFSLTSRYNFTFDEFQKAASLPLTSALESEVIMTMQHEVTHVYQILATPYGYYYASLRTFQGIQVVNILRSLREKHCIRAQYPLIKLIRSLNPKSKYEDVWNLVKNWYFAEIMLVFLEGDVNRFLRLLQHPEISNLPAIVVFSKLETLLAHFFNNAYGSLDYPLLNCRYRNSDGSYDYRGNSLESLMSTQKLSLDGDVDDYLPLVMQKLLSNTDSCAVLESWAKIAEYCGGFDRMVSNLPSNTTIGTGKYYFLIELAKQRLKLSDPTAFGLTYMTLCELALFAPLLPQHYATRFTHTPFRALHPLSRFLQALSAAEDIRPICELEKDYTRFVHDICERVRWPTPIDISTRTINSFQPKDIRTSIYNVGQRLRLARPWSFIDVGVWLSRCPDKHEEELRYYFIHPAMQFMDRTIFHKDKAIVLHFLNEFVLHQYFTKLLLSDDLTITLPYRLTEELLIQYESQLKQLLINLTGITNPYFRLCSHTGEI